MKKVVGHTITAAAFTLLVLVSSGVSIAAPTPYWFDGYDVSGPSSDINFEIGTARQGGAPAPVSYVTNTANPANDYHHQVFGAAPLQLAGDFFLPNPGDRTLVSPTVDFSGTIGNEAIGRKV
ncbi:MAG: hypothetical protein RID07_01940, partial [Lacipirellulaceae bacterium]